MGGVAGKSVQVSLSGVGVTQKGRHGKAIEKRGSRRRRKTTKGLV